MEWLSLWFGCQLVGFSFSFLLVEVHDDVLVGDVGIELDVDAVSLSRDDLPILVAWLFRRQKLEVVVNVAHAVLLVHVEEYQPNKIIVMVFIARLILAIVYFAFGITIGRPPRNLY